MKSEVKQKINKFVMLSVKSHWLFLVLLVGLQFLTGKVMAGDIEIAFSRKTIASLHSALGFLILVSALMLSLEKLYLWLIKHGKL